MKQTYDVAYWPQEQKDSLEVFQALAGKLQQKQFDDEYLSLLGKFYELVPESEQGDIFAAHYAYFYGDYKQALALAQQAWEKRKVNLEVWQLLAKCYDKLGMEAEKAKFQGYCHQLYALGLDINMAGGDRQTILDNITMSMGIGNYGPYLLNITKVENGQLKQSPGLLGGEFIPWSENDEGYKRFVGVFTNQENLNTKSQVLAYEKDSSNCENLLNSEFIFDIMRARDYEKYSFNPGGDRYLLAVAGTEATQKIVIKTQAKSYEAVLGQWEFSYYQVAEPVEIYAQNGKKIVVGKPILLGHKKTRKKLVINILVDALSGQAMKDNDYNGMPYTKEFFSQGVIFNNHFSVAEYTYPSLANIESGLYQQHSQIFNEKINVPVSQKYLTISEQMKSLGYYCVNIMGEGNGIYNGAGRGYDRMVCNSYATMAYAGVERAIQHIEAFDDTDQFLFLHVMDVHPWPITKISMPVTSQTHLSLDDRLWGAMEAKNSVYLGYYPLYVDAYAKGMSHVDRSLKQLFDYVQQHYSEYEYVIQLYSDHGASVFDKYPRILSNYQVSAVYMLRGAGVPKLGLVNELTSALDIYPVMAKLHGFAENPYLDGNLPAVFGGREREYVISQSLFPGQTYKLAIRTKEYEFQLETKAFTQEDGTVDLTDANMYVVYRNDLEKQCYDMDVLQYFIRIAREHTKSFCTWGRDWPCMTEARPDWIRAEHK